MNRLISGWIEQLWGAAAAGTWGALAAICAVVLIACLSYWICDKLVMPLLAWIVGKTSTDWDDDLLNARVLKAISQLVPAILVGMLLPDTMHMGKKVYAWTVKATDIYILWAAVHLVTVFMHGVQAALDRRHLLREHNLEILRQTVVLFVYVIGSIICLGILINRDPLAILAGLGGMAAVLMLVFRDTILSFMAGIQLTVNRMLVRGDWIVVPKAGANGEVTEVKLTTIKIRNWDNSIVTVPPYTLFTDSFQNYAYMRQSGARRVCRHVYIDQTTVQPLDAAHTDRLLAKGLVTEADLEDCGRDGTGPVNLALLRRYMERYLEQLPDVLHPGNGHPELMLMVRQLQPVPQGLPLELYFFTGITAWKPYEELQARVFDHLYTVAARFGLEIYQSPSTLTFANETTKHNDKIQNG